MSLLPLADDRDRPMYGHALGCPYEICELQCLRCEGDNLQETLVAQFTRHRAKYACTAWVGQVFRQDNGGVVIKLDVRAIAAAIFFRRTDDDRLDHFTFLNVTIA